MKEVIERNPHIPNEIIYPEREVMFVARFHSELFQVEIYPLWQDVFLFPLEIPLKAVLQVQDLYVFNCGIAF